MHRSLLAPLGVALTALLLWPAAAPAQMPAQGQVQVSGAIAQAQSPPLRNSRPLREAPGPTQIPLRSLPVSPGIPGPDRALQVRAAAAPATINGLAFPGVGNGDYGFTPAFAPPDTNLAAGDTQIVQWVNVSFAVFDKSSGALLYGPAAGNTLWQSLPAGNGCHDNNDGDIIAQFDKQAHRWVMTQFSVSTTPYLQCVAVSQTNDATGAWYLYTFSYGTVQFNDYPKLGVWPDAYYITYNIFNNGQTFAGPKVCALNRAAMLSGMAATQQCVQLSASYGTLLPSDLDGSISPPAGSPDFLLGLDSNSLDFWKFHVDWVNTANTTLSSPVSISVNPFTAACGGDVCIPQPQTSQQLDSLADRLMYRLAYRNFGDHEALVVNHSVTAVAAASGIRWYELRNPTGLTLAQAGSGNLPVVYQQGTYAPTSDYRWMGSMAMDHAGDIAVGYSISSTTLYPSIAYTGRVPGDPLGTMEAETSVKTGSGSQTGSLNRWGDYSGMSMDPVDDCTFWYTNEYLKSTGSFNWSTWIASFRFPSCHPTVTGVSPSSGSPAGRTRVSITGTGFSTDAGATAVTFGSSAATNVYCGSSTLCFAVSPPGSGTVDVVVTAEGIPSSVSPADQFTYAPATADFSVTASPAAITFAKPGPGSFSVSIAPANGFAGTVTLTPSQPAGLSALPTSSTVTPVGGTYAPAAFTMSSTTPGSYAVVVTGTSAALTHASNSVSVTVTASAGLGGFSISASPPAQTVDRGGVATYTLTLTSSGTYNAAVGITTSGLPNAAFASALPNPVIPTAGGATATLSIRTRGEVPVGTYTVTITGTGTDTIATTHSTTVTLTVR